MKTTTKILTTVSKHFLFPVAVVLLLLGQNVLYAQGDEQRLKLQNMAESAAENFRLKKARALHIADSLNLPVRTVDDAGKVTEIMRFEKGMPVYYTTNNLGGARTISTNKVWPGGSAGLSLDGSGQLLGIWDGGAVRASHQELNGRVNVFSLASEEDHATHVAGTMIATGISANAHGMGNQATLRSFDWNNDDSAMAAQAAGGLLVSNHSYGTITGWAWGNWYDSTQPKAWHWWGEPGIDPNEDYNFGFYDNSASRWDSISFFAPGYLIVKSAGNDRGQGPAPGAQHYVWNGGWVLSTTPRSKDGGITGFDCISTRGVAKNILTVGAVKEISNGYGQPADVQMSSFSGWGPTDDGRIKPDLVAKGVSVYSAESGNDSDYGTKSGTSMATPMVSGSIGLLNQHYQNTHNAIMRSATMKALLIHTADEAGTAEGPDYEFGWGLMNTESAAEVISDDAADEALHIREMSLDEDEIIELRIWPTGNEPLKATLAWTDPAGTPPAVSVNPQDLMLVNDLDMRIIEVRNQSLFSPYVLNPQAPDAAATKGVNNRDNVEQIFVSNLPQADCPLYLLQIRHKGQLQNGSQDFSLIITGIQSNMIYVKKDASGSNNGTSWNDAYTNLQTAIDAAAAGDEIWVAKGTYYPTGNGGGRFRHFNLKNCVEIYGGFAGDENAYTFPLHDRNLLQNETILDGQGDCYHVVRSYANIDATAVLDGFTVIGGNANCAYPDACDYSFDERGGGMLNEGSPTIRSSTFTGNYALTFGGGMLNMEGNPALINCTLNANDDPECGGGITNLGSSPFLINCLIHGNKASTGGGMCNDEGSNPTIINSTISSNFAVVKGGGIMSNYWGGVSATIKNSIIWGNEVDVYTYSEGHQIFVGDGNPPIELFSSLYNNGGNHIVGPIAPDPLCFSADPQFVSGVSAKIAPSSAGNYRLGYLSPAIDTGINAYVSTQQINDRDWNQRIDSLVKIVDLGAYEYPKECAAPKNLAAKKITNGTAELWWTPGGSETSWEIEYGPKGFQQGTGTFVLASQFPFSLTGLSSGTEYDFYIRGLCPPSFTSQWAGPATFETLSSLCPPSDQCLYTFVLYDSYSDGWDGAQMQVLQNGVLAHTLGQNFTTGATFTEDVPLCHGFNFEVYWSVAGLWPQEVGLQIQDASGTILYDVQVIGSGSVHTTLYSGTVNCTSLTCDPPTNFTVSYTATDAMLTWIEPVPSPQQGYEIEIIDLFTGLVVFTGNTPSGSNAFTVTGLSPSTDYEAAIRSDCGGLFSSWELVIFTTLPGTCDPPTGLNVLQYSATVVGLFWTDPIPPPQQGYDLTVMDNTGTIVFTAYAPAGTNYFVFTGLTPATVYLAEVISNCGNGLYSSPVLVTFTTCTQFTVQAPADFEVCIDGPAFALSGATPAGGTYAGNGVAGNVFDPALAGVGNHTISYTYTDAYGCSGSDAFFITVNDLPVLTCPADFSVFLYNAPFALTGGTPAGGIYTDASGNVISNFDPLAAGQGNHKISYTYTDNNGCSAFCEFMIAVFTYYDYGDAPDGPYPTLLASNGARHSTGGLLRLGLMTDGETDGQPTIDADGDDLNLLDDEDGVTFSTALVKGQTASVEVYATSSCKLNAWIDFNQSNGWADAGEHVFVDVSLIPGNNTLSFSVPSGAATGDTYTRFRVNANGGISYDGYGGDGDVEDYKVSIAQISDLDFGDAPDVAQGFNYHTLLAQNGARHVVNQAVYLGDKIDAETDGQPTMDALGDDINNLGDEDGVQFSRFMAVGSMAKVRVKASVAGYLNAWVDFNRDGNWTGATEQIYIDEPLAAGWNTLSFAVPANAQIGSSYARFRFNTAGGLSYQGAAADGEVEDYFVAIFPQSWAFAITNLSHMILVPLSAVFPLAVIPGDITLEEGDFIGAFFDDQGSPKCGGAIYIDSADNQMLIAYGDDLLTNEKDGFDNAEPFSFKIYKANTDKIIDVEATFDTSMPNFDGKFYSNGMSAFTGLNKIKLSQTLALAQGWNGISTWLDPADADVVNMFAPINNEFLILYKLNGGIYWPGQNLNTLGQWNLYDGHIINMINDSNLEVLGDTVANRTVNINNGVSLIPVLTDDVVDVVTLFNAIQGLVFVKEVAGNRIYLPNWNINTLGSLIPGSAYFVLSSQAGTISYPAASLKMSSEDLYPEPVAINHPWNEISYTPESHIVVFNTSDAPFVKGDVIGGFTSDGLCAGVVATDAEKAFALTLTGNDVLEEQKTGFEDGELLTYKVHRPSTGESFALEVVYNPAMTLGNFTANGISEITTVKTSALGIGNLTASQISIYPNPSSGKFNITGVDGFAEIEVSNAYGKLMLRQSLDLSQGIDLSTYPNGVYLLKITTSKGAESMHKLIVH